MHIVMNSRPTILTQVSTPGANLRYRIPTRFGIAIALSLCVHALFVGGTMRGLVNLFPWLSQADRPPLVVRARIAPLPPPPPPPPVVPETVPPPQVASPPPPHPVKRAAPAKPHPARPAPPPMLAAPVPVPDAPVVAQGEGSTPGAAPAAAVPDAPAAAATPAAAPAPPVPPKAVRHAPRPTRGRIAFVMSLE